MTNLRMIRYKNIKILFFWFALFITLKFIMRLFHSMAPKPLIAPAKEAEKFNPIDLMKKIDYHDYKQIKLDRARKGLGEQGLPAVVTNIPEEERERLYRLFGFDVLLSDRIPLNRSLPDIRHPKCKKTKYLKFLPSASVIIPVFNEHRSTLLRNIHSLVNRSPAHLLKEIVIANDGSLLEYMKSELESYVSKNFRSGLVKIVHLPKRTGLITARLAGANATTGNVLIFLDSHCEVNVNWLPPLLEPIALNYRTAVCPFVDVVTHDTFKYASQDEGMRGAFNWEFHYKRLPIRKVDVDNMPKPFPNPVMAGGLFAIASKFFWELGGYDPELRIWGGEQYELSFKIWQCHGKLLDAPCSRVGHIYRKYVPFSDVKVDMGDFVSRNYRRVADVWMDEYAEYIYQRHPNCLLVDPGDLTQRRQIREQLKCKSFKWYLETVAFDLTKNYPTVEPVNFAEGKIKSEQYPDMCIDANEGKDAEPLLINYCNCSAEGDFEITWRMEIKCAHRPMCWDLPNNSKGRPVLLYPCHQGGGNQKWLYNPYSKFIKQPDTTMCLDFNRTSTKLFINYCDINIASQKWDLEHINTARFEEIMHENTPSMKKISSFRPREERIEKQ